MTTNTPEKKESDLLQYRGNSVPRAIRMVWTMLTIFGIYYLVRYMVPDLREWMSRFQ